MLWHVAWVSRLACVSFFTIDENTHVSSTSQHEKTDTDKYEVQHKAGNSTHTSFWKPTRAKVSTPHPHVRSAPENEAEERIKERAHQGQQVRKEWNDLGDDESGDPSASQDTGPCRPANDGMISLVARTLENPKEDEACRHRGVKDTQEDQSWNHERKCHFLVQLIAKRSESRSCVVLCPGVDVHDWCGQGEHNDLANGYSPERLGEVLWFLHLSYETGYSNLTNKRVTDVQKGVHPADKTSPCSWNDQDYGIPSPETTGAAVWRIIMIGVSFNPGKDGRQ